MANSTCAGWGVRARSTTFARIAGGTTCTTSLRAAKATHTAPTDGATTFDSPFLARSGCFGSWESPYPPAIGQSGGFFRAFGLNRRPWRRSERRRRVPVPLCSRWRDATPFTAVACPPDDGGDARRRARTAHTARQAERARPKAGRQTAETAGMQGRAPRAQPTAPQARGTRARPPSPAKISARGRTPQG